MGAWLRHDGHDTVVMDRLVGQGTAICLSSGRRMMSDMVIGGAMSPQSLRRCSCSGRIRSRIIRTGGRLCKCAVSRTWMRLRVCSDPSPRTVSMTSLGLCLNDTVIITIANFQAADPLRLHFNSYPNPSAGTSSCHIVKGYLSSGTSNPYQYDGHVIPPGTEVENPPAKATDRRRMRAFDT